MLKGYTDGFLKEVESALKRYRQVEVLENHPARSWRAVQEICIQGYQVSTAIRRVFDQALLAIEAYNPDGATLVRERYLRGRSIEAIAQEYGMDPTSLHRRRSSAIKELAIVIADYNRDSERRTRSMRFAARHPVFGFEAIVESIINQLRDPVSPTVIVIEGMGGLGKTTLARLVAQQCGNDDSFVKVLWTSAKQVDFDIWGGKNRTIRSSPFSYDDLLNQLAKELDIKGSSSVYNLQSEVIAYCRTKPYFIIFDNLETVTDITVLAPLIAMLSTPSRVLITTRDQAHDALPATLTRQYIRLSELDANTSYQLLRSAATYTNTPALAQATDDELHQIYTITGGNPLALWLVAGQSHNIPWKHFTQSLVDSCRQGGKGYELFEYLYRRSWEQLSTNAKTVLFSMHRCEFGAEYELLWKLSELEQPALEEAIEELRYRMLLLFDGQYYSIHRLTYTFLRVVIAGWWE